MTSYFHTHWLTDTLNVCYMNEKLLEEKVISSTCLARRVKVIRLIDLSEFHMESANVRERSRCQEREIRSWRLYFFLFLMVFKTMKHIQFKILQLNLVGEWDALNSSKRRKRKYFLCFKYLFMLNSIFANYHALTSILNSLFLMHIYFAFGWGPSVG